MTCRSDKHVNMQLDGNDHYQLQTWMVLVARVGGSIVIANWQLPSTEYTPLFIGNLIDAWPVYEAHANMIIGQRRQA